MSWLLVFFPIAIGLEWFAPERNVLAFFASALAILPLAGWVGRATEQLATRLGEGVGGLLNATFGNAAELIIAFAALRGDARGRPAPPRAALQRGRRALAGDDADPRGDRTGAARGLSERGRGRRHRGRPAHLDLARAARRLCGEPGVLAGHARRLFAGSHDASAAEHRAAWSAGRAACVLAAATAAIAWMSEILVGAIEPSAKSLGLSDAFVGVFVVAILGNAAEHASAVSAAMKDRMDLSLSIAIGSSEQVALFVAPLLGQVAGDGRSDWLKGVQLLAVYVILGLAYFFLPAAG